MVVIMIKRIWLMIFILLLSYSYCGEKLPRPSGFLNDFAGILTPEEQKNIESKLSNIEKEKGIEIAVVILHSLKGESIEGYANELFNEWGIGKKNNDNGVLILIVMSERKIRIEVGYGLEELLTDGRCGSIIRDKIAPAFKNMRYSAGIITGIDAIENVVGGISSDAMSEKHSLTDKGFLIIWQLFCLFYASVVAGILGFMLIALESAIFDYFLATISSDFYMLALLVPFFTCFLLVFLMAIFRIAPGRKTGGRRRIGGFPYSSHSGAGKVSSGGGFGGGSSGGGGATGGW